MDEHSFECLDFYRVRDRLAGYSMSGLGRRLAAAVRPVARPDLIRRWFAQVGELQRMKESHGIPPFGGISDVRDLVKQCAPPLRVGVEEISAIASTLAGTREVGRYLALAPEDAPELRHLAERCGDFDTVAQRIRAVVDERGEVRDDASQKLARIRAEIQRAMTQIRETVERLLHDPNVRRLLQYANHTFHGDRLVLPVRTEYRGRLPGIVHRSSDSGATLYVEPAQAVELNNQISNLRAEESEEIRRLLWELAHEVHLNEEPILRTLDALAVLDLVCAKLRFAEDFDLRCPAVSDEAVLDVRQARHPLLMELLRERERQGLAPDPIVPINYRLGDDFDLLIITGPNTGGKTVTLKTIGLLTLMAQAGLPVPVGDGSVIGIFKNVLIDIGDEQSLTQSLSTFSAHLRRQMEMLQKAGPKTLVLIDELGAGTDPDEGAAIGRAILDELLRLHCRCIVTTHLGALKSVPLTRPRAENGCVDFDDQTLRPTYHLRIGEPGLSNALAIADRLGMPKRLLQAATRHISEKSRALHAAMVGTAAAKREAEAARDAATSAKLAANQSQSEAAAAKADFEKKQADFHAWVARVVQLRPGDPVRVRNFDRDGRVVRMRLDHHRAEIDVGSFAVEVPLGDLLPPEAPHPPPRAPRARPAPEAAARAAVAQAQPPGDGEHRPARQRQNRPPRRHGIAAGPRADSRTRGEGRPHPDAARPHVPSLTDDQAAALNPGDAIFAKRFHRDGTVVRVLADKRLAVITVGLLEVEVPFSGLAHPQGVTGVRGTRSRGHGRAHRTQEHSGRGQRQPGGGEPRVAGPAASGGAQPTAEPQVQDEAAGPNEPGAPPPP